MHFKNTAERYGALSIGFHWLMLLLIASVYVCIELREFFPKGSDPREALKTWHFMLGLSVFFLTFLRLAVRLCAPSPRIVPDLPIRQKQLAALMHIALYALMIGMPLLGWLLLSAAGKTIPFFGMELPALIAPDKDLAGLIKEIHETFGTVGYFLIGGHAAAALYHHYFLRDNTVTRMLPGKD